MLFALKLIGRIAINIAALWAVSYFFAGFSVSGGWQAYILGGIVLAVIHTVLKPILKVVSFPLLIVTFGLFNIVINLILLVVADYFLNELTISGVWTYLWSSIIIGVANSVI